MCYIHLCQQISLFCSLPITEASCLSLDTIEFPLNQIAVVSTMNFRSTWQRKFTFTHTQALSFTTPNGITLKVPTMYLRAEVNYGKDNRDGLFLYRQVSLRTERKTLEEKEKQHSIKEPGRIRFKSTRSQRSSLGNFESLSLSQSNQPHRVVVAWNNGRGSIVFTASNS